jgi:indolepyruvate ferredoxin oxidoreductase
MAGLAQKGGAVYSHMRIAERSEDIHAIRIAAGGADLVLGGDIVVAGNRKVLAAVKHGVTEMVINLAEFLPGDFTRNADFSLPTERLKRAIIADAGREKTHFIDATRAAIALFGNSVGANIFLVGYAYQLGAVPLAAASIERAIELNGEAVEMNKAAFHWGRRAVVEPAAVEALIKPKPEAVSDARTLSRSFEEMVERRVAFLTAYQNAAYAARYRRFVEKARAVEAARAPGKSGLADAVARYLFKLMAYKDEYEVARLYADDAFLKQVNAEFGGEDLRLHVHLAPPLLARKDKVSGEPRKMTFGPWIFPLFRLLAKFKFLRGTAFDPFGYSTERRTERALVRDYEALLEEVLAKLDADNHHVAVGLAAIPEKIRGFGHVKLRHLKAAKADEAALLEQFRAGPAPLLKAAE